MHETFKEIVSEISVRKVEMKMKSKPRLNLFENESDSLFSINSFVNAGDYWNHLNAIASRAKNQVESDIQRCKDMLSSLDFLETLHSELRDIRNSHLPENTEILLSSVKAEGLIKYRFDGSQFDTLKKKTLHFIELQKTVIVALEDYLLRKIRSTQSRFRLMQTASVSTIPPPTFPVRGALDTAEEPAIQQLLWNRSDTDLLELVTALYESGAIRPSSGKLTKRELQQALEKVYFWSFVGFASVYGIVTMVSIWMSNSLSLALFPLFLGSTVFMVGGISKHYPSVILGGLSMLLAILTLTSDLESQYGFAAMSSVVSAIIPGLLMRKADV